MITLEGVGCPGICTRPSPLELLARYGERILQYFQQRQTSMNERKVAMIGSGIPTRFAPVFHDTPPPFSLRFRSDVPTLWPCVCECCRVMLKRASET